MKCILVANQLVDLTPSLSRACCLATWCSNLGRPELQRPDRPLSLFEGLAGTAYFLQDMLAPEEAAFPALQL